MTDFLFDVIATELEDAVGRENCSTRTIDKISHSVDYFWLSRMWADRGLRMPEGDFIVAPKDAKEVSAVLKIANYYKIPVTTWGAGGGTQGGAIPVCGGIVLDTKDFVLRTSQRTFEAAGYLKDNGANTVQVRKFFAVDSQMAIHKHQIISSAKIFNGFIIGYCTEKIKNIRIVFRFPFF